MELKQYGMNKSINNLERRKNTYGYIKNFK